MNEGNRSIKWHGSYILEISARSEDKGKVKMEEQAPLDPATNDDGSDQSTHSTETSGEASVEEDSFNNSIIELALRNGLDTKADDTEVDEFIELIEKSGLSMRDAGIKVGEALRETWSLNIVRVQLLFSH